MADKADVVLEVKDLDITFRMVTGDVHAIRGVNFKLRENEVMSLVGESGCGYHDTSDGGIPYDR